jgi:hypothetical protein
MKKSILLCALFLIFSLNANLLDKSKEKFTLVSQTETQSDSLTFSISPNPLKTQRLFIHSNGSGEKHIEIYNVLGEKKFETQTYEESIILENLETGIYVFYLKQDNQKRYKRLVIH